MTTLELERLSREMHDMEKCIIARRQEMDLDPDCVRPCPTTHNFEQENKRIISVLTLYLIGDNLCCCIAM
jgi:hypothetical protein